MFVSNLSGCQCVSRISTNVNIEFPREQTLSAQYTVLLRRRQIVVILSSFEINCGAQTKLGNGNFTTYKIFQPRFLGISLAEGRAGFSILARDQQVTCSQNTQILWVFWINMDPWVF
jgi:hypothetical protein